MYARTGIFALFAVLALEAASSFAAPPPRDSCGGLTGPALGLCRAAAAVGCDGSASQPPSCTTIEEQYRDTTGGSEPPWVPTTCPCGSTEDFIQLASGIRELSCTHHLIRTAVAHTYVVTLDREDVIEGATRNLVFSYHPGSYAVLQKQTCGRFNESGVSLTDAQAESCVTQIVDAASARLVPCIGEIIVGK